MTLELVFYGVLAELLGRDLIFAISDEAETVADLLAALAQKFPHTADALGSGRISCAVADTIVPANHGLKGVKRIEFFPPVSGG